MNELRERYDIETAAAWILGHARASGVPALPEELRGRTADSCTDGELLQIVEAGQAAGLKLYSFKSADPEAVEASKKLTLESQS